MRAVLVVSRHDSLPNRLDAYADVLNRKLAADNIEPRPATVVRRRGVQAALLNPSGAEHVHGASIAIGTLLDGSDDWHVPGAELPDGSYALLRVNDAQVELVADSVGSRTLWYALTDRELIASTSQRAIVTLLGSFEPNRDVLPWMLSSGTLGPQGAWDARLRRVQAGERVLLDRARWRLRSTLEPIEFVADQSLSRAEHLERLRSTVTDACHRWSFDARKWPLTLSGGTDSRGLLCLFRERGIGTITWGLPGSAEQDGNDAQVARDLARLLSVPHRFFALPVRGDAPDVVLERFLALGEGRIDRISGYLDGFQVWKTLFAEGYDGVIRGDHAFGSTLARSPYAVRSKTSLTTLADYFPAEAIATFELPEQRLPESLERSASETLAAWRDRLFHQSRLPTFLAALTDLKTAYLEVGNPLLARSILTCVRTIPDELRTGKRLWREIVDAQLPGVPLARRVAIPAVTDFLADRRVLELLLDELTSANASAVFAPPLRERCCAALRAALRKGPAARRIDWRETWLARAVPARVRDAVSLWRADRPGIDPLVLAFRAFIGGRMHALFRADAATPPAEPATAVADWGSRRGGAL
jgi:hypothetical protein